MQQLDMLGGAARLPAEPVTGEQRKEAGMSRVAGHNAEWLEWIRGEAIRIAKENGTVCVDELKGLEHPAGLEPSHLNAWGCVFRGTGLEVCGMKKSTWEKSHARRVCVYRLKG